MSAPEEITFHDAPVRVGQVTLHTSEEDVRMVFALQGPDGQSARQSWSSRARNVRREEVLAVRGAVAQRVRVVFIEDLTTSDTGGQKDRSVGPLAGNTFELERKSDAAVVAVFDTSGAPVRFGVAAQVTGQYRQLGRAGNAETLKLPVGPQKLGQSSPEIAGALVAVLSRGVTVTHVDVHQATLSEIRSGPNDTLQGLYHVEMKVTGESDGSRVTMSLVGKLVLRDVDGAPLEVRLQGPITSAPQADAAGAVDPKIPGGTGELKLTHTMVYGQA